MKVSVIAALMLVSSVVSAAPSTPGATDGFSRQAAQNFARCVVNMSPKAARRALALDYRTPEYDQAVRALMRGHDRCITPGGVLRGSQVLLVGALAETILIEDVRGPLDQALRFNRASPQIASRSVGETMALCLVRKSPEDVARLMQAPIGGADEKIASQPLIAALPACLVKDASMKLNRPALRAVVALAAYRVAVANGAVPGVSPIGIVR